MSISFIVQVDVMSAIHIIHSFRFVCMGASLQIMTKYTRLSINVDPTNISPVQDAS